MSNHLCVYLLLIAAVLVAVVMGPYFVESFVTSTPTPRPTLPGPTTTPGTPTPTVLRPMYLPRVCRELRPTTTPPP